MISVSCVRETGAQMEFMIELRKLKCSCDFGDFLNQVLWNRYLLSEKDLTLKRAVMVATAMEMAVLESLEVKKTVVEPDNQDEYINGVDNQ